MTNQQLVELINQKVGQYRSMTEHDYRTHPAISRSELWKISDSPEKFKWAKDHPSTASDALLFGQYAHTLLLEPEKATKEFMIMPELNLRTKDGKAKRDELLSECEKQGVKLIDRNSVDLAAAMIAVCRADPFVMDLLHGVHEQPFFWTDDQTGEDCKCRTDIITTVDGDIAIVDYKTTTNASTNAFVRDVFKYGYHFQSGMYGSGVVKCLDLARIPRFIFIAQEKTPPYSINRIELPEDVIQYGVDVYREYLGTYHECKELDWWPGYNGVTGLLNEAHLPGYAQTTNEE